MSKFITNRRITALLILVFLVLGVTGCSNKEEEYVMAILDAQNYNCTPISGYFNNLHSPIMKTDTGFYFSDDARSLSMHYYDNETEKSVFLCNRPECLHLGDEFCTATSNKYLISDKQIYDGKIYIAAFDITVQDQARFVLLRLEPDGSNLTELITLKQCEGNENGFSVGQLFIHRGICFANYGISDEDKFVYGTMIYDMVNNTVSEMESFEFEDNLEGYSSYIGQSRCTFKAYDNYVYFNETRPKAINGKRPKTFICRYNIETKESQEANLDGTYQEVYCLVNGGNVLYSDKFGALYEYSWEEEKCIEHGKIKTPLIRMLEDGTWETNPYI